MFFFSIHINGKSRFIELLVSCIIINHWDANKITYHFLELFSLYVPSAWRCAWKFIKAHQFLCLKIITVSTITKYIKKRGFRMFSVDIFIAKKEKEILKDDCRQNSFSQLSSVWRYRKETYNSLSLGSICLATFCKEWLEQAYESRGPIRG